jgi:hypothetical protein
VELLLGGICLAQEFQGLRIFGLAANGLLERALGRDKIPAPERLPTLLERSPIIRRG